MIAPWEGMLLSLADRWNRPPWEYENAPARRVLYWSSILSVVEVAKADHEGMSPGEELIREWRLLEDNTVYETQVVDPRNR